MESIGRGLHRVRGETTGEVDIAIALQADLPDAVVAGLSAARLHRMPLPPGLGLDSWTIETPLEMCIPMLGAPLRRQGIRARRSDVPPQHRTEVDGVVATSPERTFLDLASVLDLDALVVIGDFLVRRAPARREGARRTMRDLGAILQATGPRPGSVAAGEALSHVRIGAGSTEQTLLRLALERARLPEPALNMTIHGADGTALAARHLRWDRYAVAAQHVPTEAEEETPHQHQQRLRGSDALRRNGWVELMICDADLEVRCRRAVRRIDEALRENGWDGRRTLWPAGRIDARRGAQPAAWR
ncbi:hypothetical protein [Brachybacterium phenoliresistens]|uniref:hypothetical protein n=1 Tax=Brachybacterium phenoliresistens TaxID=396014 RepID=UPI0012EC375D|nr:hypothetical protein [Brachybacterium phenoliresistens]